MAFQILDDFLVNHFRPGFSDFCLHCCQFQKCLVGHRKLFLKQNQNFYFPENRVPGSSPDWIHWTNIFRSLFDFSSIPWKPSWILVRDPGFEFQDWRTTLVPAHYTYVSGIPVNCLMGPGPENPEHGIREYDGTRIQFVFLVIPPAWDVKCLRKMNYLNWDSFKNWTNLKYLKSKMKFRFQISPLLWR